MFFIFRASRSGLEEISAMTDLTDKIERVTGPSRCPGAAPEKFWMWPMSVTKALALTTVFGAPAFLVVLVVWALIT